MANMTALITGASRGIGFAIARQLARQATSLLMTSRDRDRMEAAKATLSRDSSCHLMSICCDHTNHQEAAAAIGDWAEQNAGSLDLIVLNAGYFVEGTLEEVEAHDFEENFRINFAFNHYLVQRLLPLTRRSRLKRIVFIGSTAAYEPYPAVPTYGVAKWALRGYAMNLRRELMHESIGVTYLSPGGTLTDMWAGETIPNGRLLDPEDVAKLVSAIVTLSPQAVVEELICRPMLGDLHA